jgi:hypothetical protein
VEKEWHNSAKQKSIAVKNAVKLHIETAKVYPKLGNPTQQKGR